MDDNQIIELYFKRDENAITETRKSYGKQLKSVAFCILRSSEDAEEVENDTYLKTWESIPPQRPRYFLAYLVKICRNTALNVLQKRNMQKRNAVVIELTNELSQCIPDKKSLDYATEQELGELISIFLKSVSKENRIIFLRRYFMTESVAEIAKALGMSESKVKSSLFRTRNKFRSYLSKEGML